MDFKLYTLLYLIIVIEFAIAAKSKKELIFVQAIWRHGDRSPTKLIYKNDIYTEDKWENGWGQLSDLGKIQLMNLGAWFKKRYINTFVNETYKYREVYIRSTNVPRAIESAQSFTFGMYPKTNYTNSQIPTQVVPIHSPGLGDDDPLLKGYKYKCPCYDKKLKEINKKDYDKFKKKYKDLFPFLKNATNSKDDLTLKSVGDICNVEIEIFYNLTQPDWIYRRWKQYKNRTTLDIVCEIKLFYRLADFKNILLGKLRGALLLNNWLENIKKIIDKPNENYKKMILYSAHAETLLPLMSVLRVYPTKFIPYATALIMELYKSKNNTYYVKLLYKSNSKPLKVLSIPNCKSPCKFEKLFKVYFDKDFTSTELLNSKCNLNSCSSESKAE
uniref:Acid phosphatase n=1 Tax=Strongyloides stercoralis TaxID=6248 RepID=A0A0K0EA52_STRER